MRRETGEALLASSPELRPGGPTLSSLVGRIAERVGAVGGVQHRRAVPARDGGGDVRVAVLPSTAQEAAFVAHALRSAHVERGVAWGEMAVVARSGAQVTALRRALVWDGLQGADTRRLPKRQGGAAREGLVQRCLRRPALPMRRLLSQAWVTAALTRAGR